MVVVVVPVIFVVCIFFVNILEKYIIKKYRVNEIIKNFPKVEERFLAGSVDLVQNIYNFGIIQMKPNASSYGFENW
jgi:hypothetical protein